MWLIPLSSKVVRWYHVYMFAHSDPPSTEGLSLYLLIIYYITTDWCQVKYEACVTFTRWLDRFPPKRKFNCDLTDEPEPLVAVFICSCDPKSLWTSSDRPYLPIPGKQGSSREFWGNCDPPLFPFFIQDSNHQSSPINIPRDIIKLCTKLVNLYTIQISRSFFLCKI